MPFLQDFKTFALKGNVLDLAIGVVIGAAFGKIVTALVDDVIMPLLGLITGGVKFTDRFAVLAPAKDGSTDFLSLAAARTAGANVLAWGDFLQTILDFILIALSIFVAIRALTRIQRRRAAIEAAAPAAPSTTDALLAEIRDELRRR